MELKLHKLTLTRLHSKRIYAYSHVSSRIMESKFWSVYECLLTEQSLNGEYYLLSAGRWQKVDRDFHAAVTNFVRDQVREEPCEVLYRGIAIADLTDSKNKEKLFNAEACRRSCRCLTASVRRGISIVDAVGRRRADLPEALSRKLAPLAR